MIKIKAVAIIQMRSTGGERSTIASLCFWRVFGFLWFVFCVFCILGARREQHNSLSVFLTCFRVSSLPGTLSSPIFHWTFDALRWGVSLDWSLGSIIRVTRGCGQINGSLNLTPKHLKMHRTFSGLVCNRDLYPLKNRLSASFYNFAFFRPNPIRFWNESF